jgi:hypothetical protein
MELEFSFAERTKKKTEATDNSTTESALFLNGTGQRNKENGGRQKLWPRRRVERIEEAKEKGRRRLESALKWEWRKSRGSLASGCCFPLLSPCSVPGCGFFILETSWPAADTGRGIWGRYVASARSSSPGWVGQVICFCCLDENK